MADSEQASDSTQREQMSLIRASKILWRYILPQRLAWSAFVVLLIAANILLLYSPRILRDWIDSVKANASDSELVSLGVLFLVVGIAHLAASLVGKYLGASLAWVAMNNLREDLVEHCMSLEVTFHKEHTPGEMIERIDGDVDVLANFFTRFLIDLVGSLIMLLAVAALIALEHLALGIAVAIYVFLVLWLSRAYPRYAVPYWRASRQAAARIFSVIEEGLYAIEDLRLAGGGEFVIRKMHEGSRLYYRAIRGATILNQALNTLTVAPIFALYSATLWFGADSYLDGQMSLGTLIMLLQYVFLIWTPAARLQQQVEDFPQAGAGLLRIAEIFERRPRIISGSRPVPSTLSYRLDIEDAAFAYSPEMPVLKNVSLQLPAGERLGLLGRTGSGKTTLVNLLFRFYEPSQGRILINGINLAEYDLKALRARVAYVSQDVQLLRGTVFENISFCDPNVDETRILEVIGELGLVDWLRRLPRGLQTPLGSDGYGLSAGEAQLLACVRAFLKRPALVLLDEASSRVDPVTESLLRSALETVMSGCTSVIIAHRLGTVQNVDQILVLEDGAVAEYGRRTSLQKDPSSRFSQMIDDMDERRRG